MREKERQTVQEAALAAVRSGLSVLPIRPGTKEAKGPWRHLQKKPLSLNEARRVFDKKDGIAVVCGKVSGNLELIDFDIPDKHNLPSGQKGKAPCYGPFCAICERDGKAELLKQLILVRTPSGGMGLIYRCEEPVEKNQKLAERLKDPEDPAKGRDTLIETRGEGGYFVTVPSPGYAPQRGNLLEEIPVISADDREYLLTVARRLNECFRPACVPERTKANLHLNRPGDRYNKEATWEEVLVGWRRSYRDSRGYWHWIRPGKTHGAGATTSEDRLYVFTTNAYPLEPNQPYTKFGAYATLYHNGDFSQAAKTLRKTRELPPIPNSPAWRAENREPRTLPTKTYDAKFRPVEPHYLIAPYLPKGKCILLDADGGTGKTSLALAWAAQLSKGLEPITGAPRKTARTLYLHKAEDGSDELATVFHANGGQFHNIEFYEDELTFDDKGLDILERTIVDKRFDLVVVDAFFYFLTGMMEDTYNALPALAVMQRLNAVAQRTGCTFWNVRHTKKGTIGTKASEMGMGSVQFRNSHRGQLLLRYHPRKDGVVVATDEKGSLLVRKGDHFCYQREGLGIKYLKGLPNPFDSVDNPRTEMARDLLLHFCADAQVSVTALKRMAEETEVGWRTMQRAAKELGIRYGIVEGATTWTLMREEVQTLFTQ